MPQPNDLSRSLAILDQNRTVIAVIEMSQSSWLIGGIVPGITAGKVVEMRGLEPLTPAMRTRCSPS